ncbi:MAG: addiction module toxin RelE, partial [Thermoanaerobaculia bacterium]
MARPLRFAFEGACYHIISRGIRKEDIFLSDKDNEIFIEKMNELQTYFNSKENDIKFCFATDKKDLLRLINLQKGYLFEEMRY